MKKLLLFSFLSALFLTSVAQTTLDTAVNFSVKDIHGTTLDLFEILDEGKIVVIDFFSTAWGTCQTYAPDMQVSYETFGCNDGNVFFMGIDKGNTTLDVIAYDSIYGIQYPSVSGQDGGGNSVHLAYEIQATPTIVVITPEKLIAVKQIYPPASANVIDSVSGSGGIQQPCITGFPEDVNVDLLTVGPNPVRDNVTIVLNPEANQKMEISILNITGQKILDFGAQNFRAGKYFLQADLTKEPDGLYFIQLKHNNGIRTQKLILKK